MILYLLVPYPLDVAMVVEVPNIIFSLAELQLERIIAEIIDNSLDKNAKKIDVNFFKGSSGRSKDVGFAVFDNGDGFQDCKKLFQALEIEVKDKSRDIDEIGNFHIGLKIAPLTKYSRVDIITKIANQLYSVSFSNPQKSGISFNLKNPNHENPIYSHHENPTYPQVYSSDDSNIPSDVHSQIEEMNFQEEDWVTCVVATQPWRNLLDDGSNADDDIIQSDTFQNNLRQFLGMTYQLYYNTDEELKIRVDRVNVKPLDPFWSKFTPDVLNSKIEDMERSVSGQTTLDNSPQQLVIGLKALMKFGTFKGKTYISSELDGLKVTPYVIPSKEAKSCFKRILPEGFRQDSAPFHGKKQGGSTVLNSDNVVGFFFYRGKRLITFGNFYDMNILDNAANSIRIKVEYPTTLDDDHFMVAPNKQRLDSISDQVWQEILDALMLKSGSPSYASPFNVRAPFFDPENTTRPRQTRLTGGVFSPSTEGHYQNAIVRGSIKWIKYTPCSECNFVHEPGDLCPLAPCSTCNSTGYDCNTNECLYLCNVCRLTGAHSKGNCTTRCNICGTVHGTNPCPPQGLACERCGDDSNPCTGCCATCNNIRDSCTCQIRDGSRIRRGNEFHSIRIYPFDREENIRILKELLGELEISPQELS